MTTMFGNLLFVLTGLMYVALSICILEKSYNSTGSGIGWLVAFAAFAAYGLLSLILTIKITSNGGFNWLSNATSLRNIAIAILWLGMLAGVGFCTYIRSEWHSQQTTGLLRLLTFPVYFGAVWLPLLMLVPYAILLNPEWRDTLSPNLYKIPLVLGCVLGFSHLIIPKTAITKGIFKTSQLHFYDSMRTINDDKPIKDLLPFTTREEDERLRNAALAKIKAHKNWENELIKILEQNNPYDNYWVYVFLNDNKIQHPEHFIEPINNSIPILTSQIQKVIDNQFSRYSYQVEFLEVEALCRVLDAQFKDRSAVFRPNILKLQKVLEMPLEGPSDETGSYVEILNKYRLDIKNWLDEN